MKEFSVKQAQPNTPIYAVELSYRAASVLTPVVDARIKFIEARIPKCKQARMLANLQEELITLKQCAQGFADISKRHMEKIKAQLLSLDNGD